jgi:hypothetical protein
MSTKRWKDEIVEEVRAHREAYAASCGYDLRRTFEDLKRREAEHPERLSDLKPIPIRKRPKAAG